MNTFDKAVLLIVAVGVLILWGPRPSLAFRRNVKLTLLSFEAVRKIVRWKRPKLHFDTQKWAQSDGFLRCPECGTQDRESLTIGKVKKGFLRNLHLLICCHCGTSVLWENSRPAYKAKFSLENFWVGFRERVPGGDPLAPWIGEQGFCKCPKCSSYHTGPWGAHLSGGDTGAKCHNCGKLSNTFYHPSAL